MSIWLKKKKDYTTLLSQLHILLQTYITLSVNGSDTEIVAMEICYFLYQTCQFEELKGLKLPYKPGGGSESSLAEDSQVCRWDSGVIGGWGQETCAMWGPRGANRAVALCSWGASCQLRCWAWLRVSDWQPVRMDTAQQEGEETCH